MCQIEGCERPSASRGYCKMHYQRLQKWGDPLRTSVVRNVSIEEHLLARLPERPEGGCWEWTGTRNDAGYGILTRTDRQYRAHRLAYETWRGPLEPEQDLDHLCRNRACCNPAHLEPVDLVENVMRGEGPPARNARKTHCVRGHLLDEANTYLRKPSGRTCRACQRENQREYQARRR